MTPIFKNTLVSREDIGAHVKDHLERVDRIKCPLWKLFRKRDSIRISSLEVVPGKRSYCHQSPPLGAILPQKSFLPFVNQVTEASREGDKNPDCKILSDLYKLLGNSSTNRTSQTKSICQQKKRHDTGHCKTCKT